MGDVQSLGSIKFLTGLLVEQTFPISKSTTEIGRANLNDIIVPDGSVSRQHAHLIYNNGVWSIKRVSSTNTVTVNKRDVQEETINDNDIIGLGPIVSFLFLPNAREQKPPVSFPGYNSTATSLSPGAPSQQQVIPANTPTKHPLVTYKGEPYSPGKGKLSVEISSNILPDKPTYPLNKQVINIGRDPSNDIVIESEVVSSFHIQIKRDGDELILLHPHPMRQITLNGLLYQGRQILGHEPFRKKLAPGDIFCIGDEHGALVTLVFKDRGALRAPAIPPYPLGERTIYIGRHRDNMVVLPHPQVSGYHALLQQVQHGIGYEIFDWNSTNHVYVNGERVDRQALSYGDEIRIGPFKLIYKTNELVPYDESSSIRIDASNLHKASNRQSSLMSKLSLATGRHHAPQNSSKQIILINDISLAILPRTFVAIVGGSGTGKTTLMDALNGLRPASQGSVFYNSLDCYRFPRVFRAQIGYVPQEDIVHRDLTVKRALYYAARMRLPEDFTEAQIMQRISEVLQDVELDERDDVLVSRLSGGQRKRVSIALELLANPSAFFLDEPTSGLDPGLDRKMMLLLRKLANKGHTVILVTHATSNINMCDYVCFLAQEGRLAYYGPPKEAMKYFGKTDFAEIYNVLETTRAKPNVSEDAEKRFKTSPDHQRYIGEPLTQIAASPTTSSPQARSGSKVSLGIRIANMWKQFTILTMRYLELLRNDAGNLLILLLQAPVIGFILLFLISFQLGTGVFGVNKIVQCATTQQILTPANRPDLVAPPEDAPLKDCGQVQNFLQNDAKGQAYAKRRGGVLSALQDFIAPGTGSDAQVLLFIMAFAAVMFGCINSAREIVKEGPIYRRERAVSLGIIPYMFSKIAVLGVCCLLQSGILVLFVGFFGLVRQGVFLPAIIEVYITLALTSLAGLMIGLTISAVASNTDRAMSFIPIILLPQVIFSGILFRLNGPVLQILGAFFAARWAIAGLGTSVGLDGEKLKADSFSYQGTLLSTYNPEQARSHLFIVWLALIVMIVLLGCIVGYFLKTKDVRM